MLAIAIVLFLAGAVFAIVWFGGSALYGLLVGGHNEEDDES